MALIQIKNPASEPVAMNAEIITNVVLAYPGAAFAAAASILWGARYVYTLKIENEQMKAQDFFGEVRALNKIEDMNDFLEYVATEERSQIDEVEEELADRQVATIQQKDTLQNAEAIMKASIEAKEAFHTTVLDHLEDIESQLSEIEELESVVKIMTDMKEAFADVQAQHSDILLASQSLYELIAENSNITRNIAMEVGV